MDKNQPTPENPPAEEQKTADQPASTPPESDQKAEEGTTPPTDTAAPPPDAQAPSSTPPASPPPSTPTTPKPNKLKGIIKKGLPIITIIALIAIAGFGGYYYGTTKASQKTVAQKPATEVAVASEGSTEASVSAQASTAPLIPCISGYKPYTNDQFSVCIPKTMNSVEEGTDAQEGNGKKFTFEDDVQTLTILTDYKENLNKPTCATIKVVKVAGFQAQRYLIKDSGKTEGSCASTIKQYATLVSSGPDKSLYYIGLQKKDGSFQSDNGTFMSIDQSFRLTQ